MHVDQKEKRDPKAVKMAVLGEYQNPVDFFVAQNVQVGDFDVHHRVFGRTCHDAGLPSLKPKKALDGLKREF